MYSTDWSMWTLKNLKGKLIVVLILVTCLIIMFRLVHLSVKDDQEWWGTSLLVLWDWKLDVKLLVRAITIVHVPSHAFVGKAHLKWCVCNLFLCCARQNLIILSSISFYLIWYWHVPIVSSLNHDLGLGIIYGSVNIDVKYTGLILGIMLLD